MSNEYKVLIYGGNGYTGKLVAESLAQRHIPFYFAGRNMERLEEALSIVEERHGSPVNAKAVVVIHCTKELITLFENVDIIINWIQQENKIGQPPLKKNTERHFLKTKSY